MSKRLPYFKFIVNDWLTGDITLEEFEIQGLFTNICAYYWSKECNVTLELLKKKYKANIEQIDVLINANILKIKNGIICINFLNEQWDAQKGISNKNSENGKMGGRPRKNTSEKSEEKPMAFLDESQNESETLTKKSNIEHSNSNSNSNSNKKIESINTLAEQSSAYKNLEKSKENIFEFIKIEKPQFIEPYADYWNLFADKYGLAKVQKVTDSRKKKFKTRLAEEKFNFLKITKKLTEASDFVLTQKWMTFDWVIFSESNYVKILEGNYDKTATSNEKAININKTPEPEYTNLDGR